MIKTTITIGSDSLLFMFTAIPKSRMTYPLIFQRVCSFVEVSLADIGLTFFLDL